MTRCRVAMMRFSGLGWARGGFGIGVVREKKKMKDCIAQKVPDPCNPPGWYDSGVVGICGVMSAAVLSEGDVFGNA